MRRLPWSFKKSILQRRPGLRWNRPCPLSLERLEDRLAPATVSWINAAGGQWDQDANWSSGSVPGASDDVVINIASAATISIVSGDTEAVHSLTTAANDTLSIMGGSLTIGANSTLSGPLSMTGGALTASGTGITVTVNGTTSVATANLLAQNGATLALPNLNSYTGPAGNQGYLAAAGAGSTLSLANLTSLTPSTSFASMTAIEALSGASVDVSALSQITGGPVTLESDGAGSQLNASALTSISRTAGNFASLVQVTNHGTLLDPQLASLDGTNLTLDGTGTVSTSQMTHLTNGTLTLSGGSLTPTGLSDIDGSGIVVSGGGSLGLPAVKTYTGPSGSQSVLGATGTGSSLSLANLASLTAPSAFNSMIQFEALAGGSVNLSALPQISGGAVLLESDGTSSQLNVSALTSIAHVAQNFGSTVQVTNHGTLLDPKLGSLDGATVVLDGTGTLSTSQIAHLTNSTLNDSSATLTFAGLTDIAGSTFTITNTGVLNLPAGSTVSGQGASLVVSGGGTVNFAGAPLQVPAAGSGVTINVPQLPSGMTLFMPNSGTFSGLVLNVTAGDSVIITGGTYAGGTLNVGAGGVVDLTGGSILTYSGTFSGSGAGTVQLSSGTLVIGTGGMTLNFTGAGGFVWSGGFITSALGDLTNRGNMNLTGPGDRQFENDGTLDNFGTVVQNANLGLHSDNVIATTLKNEPGATYLIQNDTGFDNPFGGQTAVINQGTIRKTGGTGISSLLVNGVLNNTGTMEADTGTVALQPGSVTQISASTLTAGTWSAVGGATLELPPGTAITTNDANLLLSGAGSTITGISGLATNNGTFSIANGATFTTAAGLSNTGTITLGPAGTLGVQGAYSQSSGGALNEQIGGTPASNQFGHLVVNGAASLAGTFNLALVNGFTPTPGQNFTVISFGSSSGNFTSYTGLGSTFTAALQPTSLVLSATNGTATADLAVTSVTAPATTRSGQNITVSWQVADRSNQDASGGWVDNVYLSSTSSVTANSILLGSVVHSGGLAANGSYNASLTATVPGLPPGNYFVLVQADSHFQVTDSNRGNNTLAASSQTTVTVPALTLGTPLNDAFTAANQDKYYQVTVPAGGSLIVTLQSAAASGATALYIGQGSVPTPYSYLSAAGNYDGPSESDTLPISTAGTYYILAHSISGAAASAAYTITASQTSAITISGISSYSGGNAGNVTIEIDGTNFSSSASASLHLGNATIPASAIQFANPEQIYATFNLSGATPGSYTLTLTQGGQTATAPQTFQVVAAKTAALDVVVTTPESIRPGHAAAIVVTYTNTGNNDLLAPLLTISTTNAQTSFSTADYPTDFRPLVKILAVAPDGPAGILRPGQSGRLTLFVYTTDANDGDEVNLNVTEMSSVHPIDWADQKASLKPSGVSDAQWNITWNRLMAMVGTTTQQYNAALAQAATALRDLGYSSDLVSDVASLWQKLVSEASTTTKAAQQTASSSWLQFQPGQPPPPPAPPGPPGDFGSPDAGDGGEDPLPAPAPPPIHIHHSHDPNALIGPSGFGAAGFIRPAGAWSYTVDFENDGTVAAQDVSVTQQLDSNLDWSTFQLGSFGFGSTLVSIPLGLTSYQTTVAYQNVDGSALNVLVSLNFNVQTGVLTTTYTSVDPTTGEPPTGVTDGFLPPDNAAGIGEGFVQYTVQPKAGLNTGAAVNQQASIVFDINAAIPTATVVNTIDVGAPTSSVQPLPAVTNGSTIPVSWSGSDDAGGSGIASYDVYVSVNGGPFTAWLTGTTQTSASYTGTGGNTYSFYSVATDNVGNRQATPTSAQASTKLLQGSGTLVAIPVNGSGELFAISSDRGLFFYRSAVGWQRIGGAGTIQSISGLADGSGNTVLFVVTMDNALFRFSPASGWNQIGGSGTIHSISAGTDAAGQADVFVLTATNAFFEYSAAGWAQIGAANTILAMNGASSGRVLVVTADHSVFEFGPSTGWIRLTSAGFAQSLSVTTESNGNLVVFAVTQNNALFEEDLATGWHLLGAAGTIQSIDAGTDAHGKANVFALTADDSFFRYNAAGWARLGAPHTVFGMEAADSDRVFAITADSSLFANDDSFGWYRLTGSGFAAQ